MTLNATLTVPISLRDASLQKATPCVKTITTTKNNKHWERLFPCSCNVIGQLTRKEISYFLCVQIERQTERERERGKASRFPADVMSPVTNVFKCRHKPFTSTQVQFDSNSSFPSNPPLSMYNRHYGERNRTATAEL